MMYSIVYTLSDDRDVVVEAYISDFSDGAAITILHAEDALTGERVGERELNELRDDSQGLMERALQQSIDDYLESQVDDLVDENRSGGDLE